MSLPTPRPSALAPRAPIRRTLRLLRPLIWVALVIAVLVIVVRTFVSIDTSVLWFRSVHDGSTYTRILFTEIVMFLIFGGATGVVVGLVTWVTNRLEPSPAALEVTSRVRDRWTALSPRIRGLIMIAVPVVLGVRAGFAAASRWPLWLQWRNAVPTGYLDPRFGRDASYFMFVFPFHKYAVNTAISIISVSLIVLLVLGWLRGAIQLRGGGPRFAPGLRAVLSALLGVLAILKAGAYWLNRMSTATSSRGRVTGQSYTDLHVVLPAKFVLLVISLVLAVVFFINVRQRSMKLILGALATMILAGVLGGWLAPKIAQNFIVKPAAIKDEATSVQRNITSTRFAFGLDGIDKQSSEVAASPPANSTLKASEKATSTAVGSGVAARLIDPNIVSPVFAQDGLKETYYGFKSTLDVDRYDIGNSGGSTDEVIGVRELKLNGLPNAQKTWSNTHLVFTHGYGVSAAPINTVAQKSGGGQPAFNEKSLDPGQHVQNQIYFGQYSPPYSIVGAPAGHGIEFNKPSEKEANYNYSGNGGVPIGSLWRRLLYSVKLGTKNILFSSELNSDSQLLYLRNPAARIRTVAPWLALDGDIYPVVAGGQITWVADGYTTSSLFPDSQEENFKNTTATTYVKQGSTNAQPSTNVNYIRNSVVATVNAYTGAVTLYQKPAAAPDPILATWMRAFPNLVQPSSSIPSYLLPHLRYPQDLFNLQRAVLAQYHVTSPSDFYSGSLAWRVPNDPTLSSSGSKTALQPSYYSTIDGHFTLSTPLLTNNTRNIASYLSVDCDPGVGYGQLELQTLTGELPRAPQLIQSEIESDPRVNAVLSIARTNGAATRVKIGNLQTVTIGKQVLAIEPIYQQAKQGSPLPQLTHVVVIYGKSNVGFASTFTGALTQALGASPTATTQHLAQQAKADIDKANADNTAGETKAAANELAKAQALLDRIQQSAS